MIELNDAGNEAIRPGRQDSAETGERSCIVSRKSLPRRALVRFVIGPDHRVVPDLSERLPGRGLWVSANRESLALACTRNLFAKAAKANVSVDAGLVDEVERQIVARALGVLGMARRSGVVACGHDKVRALLAGGHAAVLVEAADAAPDAAARMAARAGSTPVVRCFSRTELGAALGRDEAVHVALEPGHLAESLLTAVERLKGFRSPTASAAATIDMANDRDGNE
ncbi:MAG: RNA-binding protein [Alphaproteobacteria bacterium]|nr:RNA-binding protein [Alphaproteobacteria bacterium]